MIPGTDTGRHGTLISGTYGYRSLTKPTDSDVLDTFVARVYTESTEVPGRYENIATLPRVLGQGHEELTKLPGTYGYELQSVVSNKNAVKFLF